ncbi:MAG TPA: SgcJ/EcaC family oxidoreductase [Pyrinomonadaceae bacterium]|jgi:uncharacterized protein (TIGR02246 family)|nr:SgcJ/EcaC family oxidoreductase [Pyrinomonadaceae bacterium]
MKIKFGLIFLLLNLAVSAFAQSETPLGLDSGVSPHREIDDIYKKFNAVYKTLDVDGVADLYTETADYLPAGGKPLKGRAEIRQSFAGFFSSVKQRDSTMSITFQINQREVTDKLGYDVGVYTLTTFENGRQLRQGRGRFVVVTKKTGKTWRFQLDAYSDLPAEKKP